MSISLRLIKSPISSEKSGGLLKMADKSQLKLGNNIAFLGGALWTVSELLFESKGLIPALQQLLAEG